MPISFNNLLNGLGLRSTPPAPSNDRPATAAPSTSAPASVDTPAVSAPAVGTVANPTDVQKTLATDAIATAAIPRPAPQPLTTQQQAVSELRALIKDGKLTAMLAAEAKTGKLTSPEAEKIFAALPTLTAATTAKDLLDLGLISKVPEGLNEMYATAPKYFVGRQVLVSVPVDTDFKTPATFHTYKEGGEKRVTHRAYVVGEAGGQFKVLVDGKTEPVLIAKSEIYRLNEGQQIAGKSGQAYGAKVDYAQDAIMKAKVCAALVKLDDLIGKLDFRTHDPELVKAALAKVPAPATGTLALSGAGKMVDVSTTSQDGVGALSSNIAKPLRALLEALGQDVGKQATWNSWSGSQGKVGPMVQRILNTLVDGSGHAKDLGALDWTKLAGDLQVAIKKDATLVHQREALKTVHGEIQMKHPRDWGAENFGTQYRGDEAGKLANGGIGVCNVQASVLFAMLQPMKHVLGYDTQLEMGACIKPRAGRDGKMQESPPHGWVMVGMWPSGERYVSDRTWHHPCLALDYAFSPSGDRRHIAWDNKVAQSTTVTSKQIDMSGTFLGAKPVPVTNHADHGRPDH